MKRSTKKVTYTQPCDRQTVVVVPAAGLEAVCAMLTDYQEDIERLATENAYLHDRVRLLESEKKDIDELKVALAEMKRILDAHNTLLHDNHCDPGDHVYFRRLDAIDVIDELQCRIVERESLDDRG